MKYRKMTLDCHNNLDIYGSWEDLKDFFINNSSDSSILSIENIDVIDWDRDIMEEKTELIYYVFMTKEGPPTEWLDKIAKMYTHLEFNLIYQNRETGLAGEIVYKKGKIYYNFKVEDEEENYSQCIEINA